MASRNNNPENPFAALLDPHHFPSQKERKGTITQEKQKIHRHRTSEQNASDDDEALFLQAVSIAAPMRDKENALPRQKSARRASSDTLPETLQDRIQNKKKKGQPQGRQTEPISQVGTVKQPTVETDSVPPFSSTEEEGAAFLKAMGDVIPLAGKGREVPPPPPLPAVSPQTVSNPLQDLVDGKVEFALSETDEYMEGHVVGLDLLTVGRLQARQYSPEVHIDLHGLNSEQAFHNLVNFFRSAYHKGVRTALVVTGRGLNSPNAMPVLRSKVGRWLTQEPFKRVVLAFCTAKREDGGTGALYVLLRKFRKNSGKVRWDALPADPDLFL